MIRLTLYLLFIAIALGCAAVQFVPADLSATPFGAIAERLQALGLSANVMMMTAWGLMALTGLFYVLGIIRIFWGVGRDPWRAVLFVVSMLVMALGLGFYYLQLRGMVDQSSLYLVGVMILPFIPAVIYLPFAATYRDFLARKQAVPG